MGDTTYTGQSTKGETVYETKKRVGQTKNEGTMADRSAVQEAMTGPQGDLAAASRRRAEQLKKKREEAGTEEAITRRKALINR